MIIVHDHDDYNQWLWWPKSITMNTTVMTVKTIVHDFMNIVVITITVWQKWLWSKTMMTITITKTTITNDCEEDSPWQWLWL
jgi:hypothetical protein